MRVPAERNTPWQARLDERTLGAAGYLADMTSGPDASISALNVEHVFQMLFAAAGEGLVVVDAKGTILLHNPRLNDMFGYAEDELNGASIWVRLGGVLHVFQSVGSHRHPWRWPCGGRLRGAAPPVRTRRHDFPRRR